MAKNFQEGKFLSILCTGTDMVTGQIGENPIQLNLFCYVIGNFKDL